jgi:AcrR family transcriptional regulator
MTHQADSDQTVPTVEQSSIESLPDELKSAIHAARAAARHRAPAMRPEDRRAAIVSATVPLLCEYGANVTTSQIAQAAGIAEGTIFRVFPEKHGLVVTALSTAMRADTEVERIRQIPLTTPLAERLTAALSAIADYQDRFWALMRVFREVGWQPGHDDLHSEHSREHPMRQIGVAIRDLLAPDADSLRLEPSAAARMLMALAFSNRMADHGLGQPPATAEQIVDLFLHGALVHTNRLEPDA